MKYFIIYKNQNTSLSIISSMQPSPTIVHTSENLEDLKTFLKLLSSQQADIIRIIKGKEIGFKITTDLDIVGE